MIDPFAPRLREATDEENALIQRLSVAVSHRLLRDWEELPSEAKVLPMNRALLAAIGHAMGKLLGAVAVNEPDNVAGWNELVEQSVAIVRHVAAEARELAISPDGQAAAAGEVIEPVEWKRALVPEPKTVM